MRSKCRTMLAALIAVIAATALSAAPALASGKPLVETKPATSIGETTATLNGGVDPNGATTKYHFEYGTTTSYGKSTAEVSVGSGISIVEEAKAITELTINTTYHFRIVATNSNGTTDGADEKFSTLEKAGLPEFVPTSGETFPVKIESKSGFVPTDFTTHTYRNKIECDGGTLKGEITSRKKVAASDELTGCKAWLGEWEICNAVGAAHGVIVLSGGGNVAYIEKSTKKVGIVLALTPATIECDAGAYEFNVRGSLLGPVTPINTKTTSFTLAYRGGGNFGEEEFKKYENEKGESVTAKLELNIDGAGWSEMALEAGALGLTASKAFTISA